ncbi:hypothetical protein F1880_009033 [Penicillium rolfsii]|nr:hypothetical protein F1880_009033 [Penicillium rolfsii]
MAEFNAPPCRYRNLRSDLLDETLVDAHLVLVPGLGTLTVGGLTGGDVQGLGGQTDGALDLQGLGASTVDQLLADLLEGRDLAGGEGDTDLVDLLQRALAICQLADSCIIGDSDILACCIAPAKKCVLCDMPIFIEGCNVRGPRRTPSQASGKTS